VGQHGDFQKLGRLHTTADKQIYALDYEAGLYVLIVPT
jgi:hypothetical protein